MKPRMGIPMHPEAYRRIAPEKQKTDKTELYEQWQKLDSKEQYEKYWEMLGDTLLRSPDYRKSILERTAQFVVKIHDLQPDTMVFMESRARVLGVLIKKVWERVYPDEKCPEVRFLIPGKKLNDEKKTKYLSDLKDIFSGHKDAFSNKKVLVVDETASSGTTLATAADDLRKVFPDTQIYLGGFFGNEKPYLLDRELDVTTVYTKFHPFYTKDEQIKISDEKNYHSNADWHDRTDVLVAHEGYGPLAGHNMNTQRSASSNKVIPGHVNNWGSMSLNGRMSVLAEYETLDENSLHSIENAERYSRENNAMDNFKYLIKVREAYKKLMGDTFDRQK